MLPPDASAFFIPYALGFYFCFLCVCFAICSVKSKFFDCFARSASEMFAALKQQEEATHRAKFPISFGKQAAAAVAVAVGRNKMRVSGTFEVVKVIKMTIFGTAKKKR